MVKEADSLDLLTPKWHTTTYKNANQALDDDEYCGNLDCKDPLRPGEMVKCAGAELSYTNDGLKPSIETHG